ncbi:SUMF1/EgtB/PvdO family nonheme iron enzyme, partial [bacterium]|nr:SUMF1/EgtB/PvdO family nonheme iron enzyme [bacterium]
MKPWKASLWLVAIVAAAVGGAHAGPPATVFVGDPGNSPDHTTFGAVRYSYRIGKYEVTNAEYCAFLNAAAKTDAYGLYSAGMAGQHGGIVRGGAPGALTYAVKPGMGNKPVNFVSWYDAVRYANWLTNGRGDGSTETGAYTIRQDGQPGNWPVAMPDHEDMAAGRKVRWALASENEWYKAAYYDPKKPRGPGYWDYATRSDSAPARGLPPGTAPAANYNTHSVTDVGAYTDSASAYGAFDQNGGMWEWNETRSGGKRGVRGGSFYMNDKAQHLRSATRYVSNPASSEHVNYGFRVVALGGSASRGSSSVSPPRKVAARPAAPAAKPVPS